MTISSRPDDTCQLDMYTLQSFHTPNMPNIRPIAYSIWDRLDLENFTLFTDPWNEFEVNMKTDRNENLARIQIEKYAMGDQTTHEFTNGYSAWVNYQCFSVMYWIFYHILILGFYGIWTIMIKLQVFYGIILVGILIIMGMGFSQIMTM